MLIIIATIASIIAAIFVARGNALIANSIWAVSNVVFIWYNVYIAEWEMVMLFGAYWVIALYGVWNLQKRRYIK